MNDDKPKTGKKTRSNWWRLLLVVAILATIFSFGVVSRPSVVQAVSAQAATPNYALRPSVTECETINRHLWINWPEELGGTLNAYVRDLTYCHDGSHAWQDSKTTPYCTVAVPPGGTLWKIDDCTAYGSGTSELQWRMLFYVSVNGFGDATYDWKFTMQPNGAIAGHAYCSSPQTPPFVCASGYTA